MVSVGSRVKFQMAWGNLLENGCPRSVPLLIPPCSLTRRWVTRNWYPWLGGEQKSLSVSELCNTVGHVPGSVRIVTKNSQRQSDEEIGDLWRPHWYSLIVNDCRWNTRRAKAVCWSSKYSFTSLSLEPSESKPEGNRGFVNSDGYSYGAKRRWVFKCLKDTKRISIISNKTISTRMFPLSLIRMLS